jgi:hypothetical protein
MSPPIPPIRAHPKRVKTPPLCLWKKVNNCVSVSMCSLVDWLCATLFCSKKELEGQLRDPIVRHTLRQHLQSENFVLTTNHLRKHNRHVVFSDWCPRPARVQYAYNGKCRVTVEQHMLCRHRLELHHANLLCVRSDLNKTNSVYYPIECLHIHRKGEWSQV